MIEWRWYFTPSIGVNGAAFEAQTLPSGETQIRKVTNVILGPEGEIGLLRWVPLHAKMCEPIGSVSLCMMFPANKETSEKLENMWKTEGTILNPGNGRLRLT